MLMHCLVKPRARQGFTLVELIVIIAAIAILAVGALKIISGVRGRAKVARILEDLNNFQAAFTAMEHDTGYYPKDGEIEVLYDSTKFASYGGDPDTWRGPYIPPPKGDVSQKPKNPYGGDYDAVYRDVDGDGYTDYGVVVKNVPLKAAEKIDIDIDGKADGSSGRVRYGNPTNGRVDVTVIFGSE